MLISILFLSYFSTLAQQDSLRKRIQVYQLPQVVFHFDRAELLKNDDVNSEDSLDYLYEVLINNPRFIVEIRNHTDCRTSTRYGRNLSLKRAQVCVKHLINKGISPDRLRAIGMMEREPLPGITCQEIAQMKSKTEKEIAHQKNRRTDFKVVSWDFVE